MRLTDRMTRIRRWPCELSRRWNCWRRFMLLFLTSGLAWPKAIRAISLHFPAPLDGQTPFVAVLARFPSDSGSMARAPARQSNSINIKKPSSRLPSLSSSQTALTSTADHTRYPLPLCTHVLSIPRHSSHCSPAFLSSARNHSNVSLPVYNLSFLRFRSFYVDPQSTRFVSGRIVKDGQSKHQHPQQQQNTS